MNADDLRPVVLVILAMLAVGTAASTLDAGTDVEPAEPPDAPDRPEPGDGVELGGSETGISFPTASCPGFLTDRPALGGAVLAALALGGAVYRVRGSPIVPVVVIGPILVGLLSLCGPAVDGLAPPSALLGIDPPSTPVLLGLLLPALGGVFALLYVVTGTDEQLDSNAVDEEPTTDLSAVGEAAGAAADRIERQADVTNEVYRAWREMTTHLDVANPGATTPAEFAEAATDAGMDRTDVDTLTRLFEEVRYGDKDPDVRADRAVGALRRIERAYGSDGE